MSDQSFVSDTRVSQRNGEGDSGPQPDDVALLMGLSSTWGGLDPTAIAERMLECLLQMLDLDFVGIRFANTEHMFLRMRPRLETRFKTTQMAEAISAWLSTSIEGTPSALRLGSEEWTTASTQLGELASIGVLVAGRRSADFPSSGDWLRLRIAAAQTSLACRELRDQSAATDPPDGRPDRPTGASLAESEWRLNLTINTIPAIVWSAAPDGLLDFVNQHFCDFVGLTSEEILGLGFYRIFHPDDTAHLLSEWQDIMLSGQPREVEGRLLRHDGEFRWCTLRQKPLRDARGRVIKWYGVVLDIEDRKRAETDFEGAKSALVASEQNLKLIIDSLPVLAWSAKPDGSADFVNQSWTDYVGASAEQILDWGFLKFYHPDDIQSMVEIWKRDLAHSDRTSLKGRIRGADGNYRWFYFSGRKVTDVNGVVRWFGVNVDIDDLQRAQDALRDSEAAVRDSEAAVRESEKRLSLVISTIPAMVWSATPDGKVDFFNKNLIDYVGLPFDSILGFGFYQMFHPDDQEPMRSTWNDVLVTKVGRPVEGRIRRYDGEYRWFTLRQSPLLDAAGDVIKWYGVIMDIEDRRRAEEELRRTQSDLAHVSRVMTMGELAVSIAHELNQPLMAIVTNAGTCLRWLDDAQLNLQLARQAAKRIIEDGHRAGDIVTSIRSLSRKSSPDVQRVSVEELVRQVLDLLNGELRAKKITIRLEFWPGTSDTMGDRIQLQQVVMNLVMNAIEAMGSDNREHRTLTVYTRVAEHAVTVGVADTGPGLNGEDKERVFTAFYTTKPEGIGMGLSICRSIVEAHGGTIAASDNDPRGSVFSFTLPLAERPPAHVNRD